MPDPDAPDALDENASGLAALADPVRRSLYRFVAAKQEPVSRERAAEGVGVPAHTAKFHLDRLVEEGLLDVLFRRLTGRSGPGAGRPAKLYRRSDREFALSLPQRSYDLLSEILARAVDEAISEDAPMAEVASRVARDEGRSIGVAAARKNHDDSCLERLAVSLRPHGYEPRIEDRRMVLENCPFDKVARDHTDLVCGLNLDFVDGVADGLGCDDLRVTLEPSPGRCCVSARPES
ncbi:MAG: transcriptional regulator [Marmoricola sp.]|nr:transcriptional regulator [Marmoricola sp.]